MRLQAYFVQTLQGRTTHKSAIKDYLLSLKAHFLGVVETRRPETKERVFRIETYSAPGETMYSWWKLRRKYASVQAGKIHRQS